MIVYRLTKEKYKGDLSGKGAEISGGRWNSKGIAMIYTGQSRALCTTEIAVHSPLGILPSHYCLVTLEFPDTVSIFSVDAAGLAADWKTFPHPHSTQAIGDDFLMKRKYLVLKVPSVVVPGEFNYLINPAHTQMPLVSIMATEPFEFDERLFIR